MYCMQHLRLLPVIRVSPTAAAGFKFSRAAAHLAAKARLAIDDILEAAAANVEIVVTAWLDTELVKLQAAAGAWWSQGVLGNVTRQLLGGQLLSSTFPDHFLALKMSRRFGNVDPQQTFEFRFRSVNQSKWFQFVVDGCVHTCVLWHTHFQTVLREILVEATGTMKRRTGHASQSRPGVC